MRRLIPYAGFEPRRKIPTKRANELRDTGMSWKQIAKQLSEELDLEKPYTADSVHSAVVRARKEL